MLNTFCSNNRDRHVFVKMGEEGEAWKWRRKFLAWEEELGREYCVILLPIVLEVDMNDMWIWQLHTSSKYNFTIVYNFLTSRDQSSNNDHNTLIWHKEVPLKVNIFVWRHLQNCLPTTNNLIKHWGFQPNTFILLRRWRFTRALWSFVFGLRLFWTNLVWNL